MAETKKQLFEYTEESIKSLDWREHIRLRPGMYIGKLGDGSSPDDGIYVLVKEVLDNCIDEYTMGYGKTVEIAINGKTVTIRDYGRGIPLGKVVDVVSKINTGAKYDSKAFQKSVGLNGVGTKAVNALSNYFKVASVRDGKVKEAEFERGVLIKEYKEAKTGDGNGTIVTFIPDEITMPRSVCAMDVSSSLVFGKNGEERRSRLGRAAEHDPPPVAGEAEHPARRPDAEPAGDPRRGDVTRHAAHRVDAVDVRPQRDAEHDATTPVDDHAAADEAAARPPHVPLDPEMEQDHVQEPGDGAALEPGDHHLPALRMEFEHRLHVVGPGTAATGSGPRLVLDTHVRSVPPY
jgi:hypothetical protein